MLEVDSIHQRWTSIIEEIEYEKEIAICCLDENDDPISMLKRKAITGMTENEIRYFYNSLLIDLINHEAVELFAFLEHYLFDDAFRRKSNAGSKLWREMRRVTNNSKVADIISIWKRKLSPADFGAIFDIIDDARHHRNWIAHGRRFPCLTQAPLKPDETYLAISILQDEIVRNF